MVGGFPSLLISNDSLLHGHGDGALLLTLLCELFQAASRSVDREIEPTMNSSIVIDYFDYCYSKLGDIAYGVTAYSDHNAGSAVSFDY